jgi:Predicted membrane protein
VRRFLLFYKTERPVLHAWRAIWGAIAIVALFIGIRNVPLADCISLTFLGPVFVTILSTLFLGEKIRMTRISAIILGIIGGLIIIKPTFDQFNFFYFMPLIFAFGFAQVALSIKSLSKTEPNYLIAFYFSLLSMLIGLATIVNGWVWPTIYETFLFIVLGLAGGYANILLTQSLRMADTGLVTPIKYLSLVFAATAGYFIFGETLKLTTLVGAGFIVVGTYIIFRRERTLKKQVVPPRYET